MAERRVLKYLVTGLLLAGACALLTTATMSWVKMRVDLAMQELGSR